VSVNGGSGIKRLFQPPVHEQVIAPSPRVLSADWLRSLALLTAGTKTRLGPARRGERYAGILPCKSCRAERCQLRNLMHQAGQATGGSNRTDPTRSPIPHRNPSLTLTRPADREPVVSGLGVSKFEHAVRVRPLITATPQGLLSRLLPARDTMCRGKTSGRRLGLAPAAGSSRGTAPRLRRSRRRRRSPPARPAGRDRPGTPPRTPAAGLHSSLLTPLKHASAQCTDEVRIGRHWAVSPACYI